MANDREVLRLVWDGRIPICFNTDPTEVVGMQHPEPVFLLVSRMSFLPLITEKVTKHFNRYIANEHKDDVWFECNGRPLKWNYPVGVLYDLFGRDDSQEDEQSGAVAGHEQNVLPWNITVHFGSPPDHILRCPCKEVVESQFMSALKEADFLKHRGQIISTMQKKDHSQLWLGLLNDKFDQFWAVNRRLMESCGDQDAFKHIPVRCYNSNGVYTQKLISPVTEQGAKTTLGHLLDLIAPEGGNRLSGVIHGILVDPVTPLQWLSEHMSHPDNFLHICLRPIDVKEIQEEVRPLDERLPLQETATEC